MTLPVVKINGSKVHLGTVYLDQFWVSAYSKLVVAACNSRREKFLIVTSGRMVVCKNNNKRKTRIFCYNYAMTLPRVES